MKRICQPRRRQEKGRTICLERPDNQSNRHLLRLKTAAGLDAVMCALINGIQWQLRYLVCTPEELDNYLSACEPVSRSLFYKVLEKPAVAPDRKLSPVAKSCQNCVSRK